MCVGVCCQGSQGNKVCLLTQGPAAGCAISTNGGCACMGECVFVLCVCFLHIALYFFSGVCVCVCECFFACVRVCCFGLHEHIMSSVMQSLSEWQSQVCNCSLSKMTAGSLETGS